MSKNLMLLPSNDAKKIRLVCVPDDYEQHEAYRKVTGLIADVQENQSEYSWDELASALESQGFEPVEYMLGPVLD